MQEQEDKVKYAIHKINNKNNEIVQAWISKELELHCRNQALKEDKSVKELAIVTVGLALLSTILAQPIITTGFVIGGGGAIGTTEAHKQYLLSKEKIFKKAIFNFKELKEYEETHPEAEKITENETLKGVSKRKILKRLK